ncbi:MAG: hypothetical protein U0169_19250 [Polyangiaceae bacterium]
MPPDRDSSAPPADKAALRLTDDDFATYRTERAGSSAFAAQRNELKRRMLTWASDVVSRLESLGVSMDVSATDDQPSPRNGRRVTSQRVYFWRHAGARARLETVLEERRGLAFEFGNTVPHTSHVYLALTLDEAAVSVSLELHPEAWLDLKNFRARLNEPVRALEFEVALDALPEQFTMGLTTDADDAVRPSAQHQKADTVRSVMERAIVEQAGLWVGWTIPRAVAVDHTEIVDEQLEDALVALAPVYRLVAWASDNDLLGIDRKRAPVTHGQAKDIARASRERAALVASQRVSGKGKKGTGRHGTPKGPRAKRAGDPEASRTRRDGPYAEPTRDDDARAGERDRDATPMPPPAFPKAMRALRSFPKRRGPAADVDPSAAVEKGVNVHVLEGPFSGKRGIVQELDGKGGARVMLGLLAMWIPVRDLVAVREGQGRNLFATSHRKRRPGR